MKSLMPLRWSEGMFLKPHHLQQADLYQDAPLGDHLHALNPFHWGVFKLRVDVDALENLIFKVDQCEVVFPEGLIVNYPGAAVLEPASFQDTFAPTAEALAVYLAARRPSPDDGVAERFASRSESRRDLLIRYICPLPFDFVSPKPQAPGPPNPTSLPPRPPASQRSRNHQIVMMPVAPRPKTRPASPGHPLLKIRQFF